MSNIDFQNGYIAGLASKSTIKTKVLEKTIFIESGSEITDPLYEDITVQANDNITIETTVQLESEE